jgi:hypothetical protein
VIGKGSRWPAYARGRKVIERPEGRGGRARLGRDEQERVVLVVAALLCLTVWVCSPRRRAKVSVGCATGETCASSSIPLAAPRTLMLYFGWRRHRTPETARRRSRDCRSRAPTAPAVEDRADRGRGESDRARIVAEHAWSQGNDRRVGVEAGRSVDRRRSRPKVRRTNPPRQPRSGRTGQTDGKWVKGRTISRQAFSPKAGTGARTRSRCER